MWLLSKRTGNRKRRTNVFFCFLLSVPCFLSSGCGFQPLYGVGTNKETSPVTAGIVIDSIKGRMGQQFKADLEDRLNPGGAVPANAPYRLSVSLTSTAWPMGVARDGTISRYNVYLDSTYVLYRRADGRQVASGSLRHVSSYNNVSGAYFSTYVSEADAIKRGITELAEVYRQRLSGYLSDSPTPLPPPGLDPSILPEMRYENRS